MFTSPQVLTPHAKIAAELRLPDQVFTNLEFYSPDMAELFEQSWSNRLKCVVAKIPLMFIYPSNSILYMSSTILPMGFIILSSKATPFIFRPVYIEFILEL